MRKIKFAFISTHPAPYRDEFLRQLAQTRDLDVTIFSQFEHDLGHPFWALGKPPYSMKVLVQRNKSTIPAYFRYLTNFVLSRRYDCVCWNGFPPYWYHMLPLFLAAVLRKKYGIYVDTVRERHATGLLHSIKAYIIRRASFFFVPGRASCEFLARSYNVPYDRVCFGAYALDGNKLDDEIARLKNNRSDIRKQFGLAENEKVYLMVANMLPNRKYPLTTAAFLEAMKDCPDAKYVIVGKGEDLTAMQDLSKTHKQIVVIPGCSFEEMKKLYAMADVYVHGGCEPASTALVIGGLARLPIVSSKDVGCTYDCVVNGVSGVEVELPQSRESWVAAFKDIQGRMNQWSTMGLEANKLSHKLDVDACLPSLISLVMSCSE